MSELTFGNFQLQWKVLENLFQKYHAYFISNIVTVCIIMHNMIVKELVMGCNSNAVYDPKNIIKMEDWMMETVNNIAAQYTETQVKAGLNIEQTNDHATLFAQKVMVNKEGNFCLCGAIARPINSSKN